MLGSLAATRYDNSLGHSLTRLTPAQRSKARESLAEAMNVASKLHGTAARALTAAAKDSFVNGVHLAVEGGAILVGLSALAVARYLPRDLTHEVAGPDALEALEDTEAPGLAAVLPGYAATERVAPS